MKLLLSALLALIPSVAVGHSFYDAWCCSPVSQMPSMTTGDCAPIPSHAIKAVNGGWEVTLEAGEHPLVTSRRTYFMAYKAARQSKDDQNHACFFPNEETLRCLYVVPMGF